jgi:hypothetical protein
MRRSTSTLLIILIIQGSSHTFTIITLASVRRRCRAPSTIRPRHRPRRSSRSRSPTINLVAWFTAPRTGSRFIPLLLERASTVVVRPALELQDSGQRSVPGKKDEKKKQNKTTASSLS